MMPQNDGDYKKMFSELLKKQMMVLGPDITLAKVKNVPGLTVDSSGEVLSIEGDPQVMLQSLINQFVELSGMIVKKTMESILTAYPGMMGVAAGQMMGMTSAQSSPTQPHNEGIPVPASPQVQQGVDAAPLAPQNEKPHTEPPSMAEMNLDSVKVEPQETPKKAAPQDFSESEMADLNKALEDLAKAPLATENSAQQPQTAS